MDEMIQILGLKDLTGVQAAFAAMIFYLMFQLKDLKKIVTNGLSTKVTEMHTNMELLKQRCDINHHNKEDKK
jgi:hypothetical protein